MNHQEQQQSSQSLQVEGRWTRKQHELFLQGNYFSYSALVQHGKNWKLIQKAVQTRTTSQVRSHAQKFFLKLVKVQKQRKKNHKKGIMSVSKVQEQLVKQLCLQSFTSETPVEILQFLNKEGRATNLKRADQPLEKKSVLKQEKRSQKNAILTEMLQLQQDQSFLVALMKHSRSLLEGDQGFADLIDFPFVHKQQKQEEQTSNKRKISFSLYEEDEDCKKYKEMIKKVNGL